MSVPLPLEELRAELERRGATVYLLTVGDDGRPRCVSVRVAWEGEEIVVRTGRSSGRNAQARPAVTLLAAPCTATAEERAAGNACADLSGYSLIVDGDVSGTATAPERTAGAPEGTAGAPGGALLVRIRPTHAVFHRPAEGSEGLTGAPLHDCVPAFERPAGDDRAASRA